MPNSNHLKNFSFQKKFRRVIQFELNEISKTAIDHLLNQGKLPNFSRINHDWFYANTTSEQQYQHLEPWIQWISAHTGKSFAEHKIFHLSDATQLTYPQIWEALSDHGVESCIVGSMNAVRGNAKGGFFFPDPWSKNGITYPQKIQPLWDLISSKVQSHATAEIDIIDLLKGLQICLDFKLPFALYQKIAKQFISQKINPLNKWKLAGLFDLLLSKIFNHLLKSSNYGYYTLFLNAVAHYQHHYWRNFQKNLFNADIVSPDCKPHHDPLAYGYELYDEIIHAAVKLAEDPHTLVIIASGLSQQPFTAKENEGGMNYYRLYQHQQFIEKLGITHCRALPLMSRDWQIEANDQSILNNAKIILSNLTVNNEPIFKIEQNTPHSLFIETAITCGVANDAIILKQPGQSIGLFNQHFHRTAVKSGHHIGTGSLWLSQKPIGFAAEMPLTDLYPLTLSAFGITNSAFNTTLQLDTVNL
jgi:hypothetical protein